MRNASRLVFRVVRGPLTGAAYRVGSGLTIGRSESNDIRLTASWVSRAHARVVPLDDGGLALTDLGSANGTFVADERVEWCRLEPGAKVTIGDTMFRVDEIAERWTPVPHSQHAYSLQHPVDDAAQLACQHARGDYEGDLVDDVRQLRALRTRQRRHALDPVDQAVATELEAKLGGRAGGSSPGFEIVAPGTIRLHDGTEHGVVVRTLGLDGARLTTDCTTLRQGYLVWLAIPMVRPTSTRTAVFAAYVTRCEPDGSMSLAFSGTTPWAAMHGTRSTSATRWRDTAPTVEPSPRSTIAGNVHMSVWTRAATVEDIARVDAELATMSPVDGKVVMLLVVPQGVPLSPMSAQRRARQMLVAHRDKIGAVAIVLRGTGMWAAAVRAMFQGIAMLQADVPPWRVFLDAESALTWLGSTSTLPVADTGTLVDAAARLARDGEPMLR